MGRPPCCDKVGIKKGPWTPEEDIILVSYIQEHGPGNWRSVPTNTGLLRCSKSCRLRWTNYLRPGIKRGNFTPHEEGMIIHLQALLGNKWAAIASYLPQRTDNDIKNYWNTHLKKKIKRFQSALDHPSMACSHQSNSYDHIVSTKSLSDKSYASSTPNLNHHHHNSSSSTTYASSTENISRLLQGWMSSTPKGTHENNSIKESSSIFLDYYGPKGEHDHRRDLVSNDEFESILSFDDLNGIANNWDKSSSCDSALAGSHIAGNDEKVRVIVQEKKLTRSDNDDNSNPPLSVFEKWLLEESGGQVEEMMEELPPIF